MDYIGRDAIIKTLESNDTVIVMGETGSGKTTRKVFLSIKFRIETKLT